MNGGQAYRMRPADTMLSNSDYSFLERFLDVTKANLFFAKGVLIVEGDAEALLLPVLADLLGRSPSKCGVSIVNVGHVGLFRYARIFRRRGGLVMPVRVACVADRDIPPAEAKAYLNSTRKTEADFPPEQIAAAVTVLKRNDGGAVQTFVSPRWTLEYDLARTALARYVYAAVSVAVEAKKIGEPPSSATLCACLREAYKEVDNWLKDGKSAEEVACLIYEPLLNKRASKPETAQCLAWLLQKCKPANLARELPHYLVDAIDYVTVGSEPLPSAVTERA